MITELYQRTLKELTSSNRAWMDFLKTAAFQYKYPFSDQVLIHAQRPGAVACAELEVWNEKFGRWVNKGTHGIALIRDKGGRAALTHVFDVRDTHHRDELPFRLWETRSEMRRDIAEALENSFGHLPMKATIGDAAISACKNICEDNLTDYLDNLMSSADGSLLDDYDEDNMRVRLLPLLKYSTAYAVLTRLGYKADESLDMDDLAALREFNTPEVINVLGTATGDLSEICLREIERTVRAYEKNKIRTFAETENVRYNNPEKNNTLGTVLPYGAPKLTMRRTLTTESLAVFMPFRVQEVCHNDGIYFANNAISKNMIMINRNELLNGNSFITGVSGSGKSLLAKQEVINLFLADKNADIIIIDPEKEYGKICDAFGGETIEISATSSHHINAMDINMDYADGQNPVTLKSEFMLSLCEQAVAGLGPKQKSLIDRCTANVLNDYMLRGFTGNAPTLQDFNAMLKAQPEPEAKDIALSLELFTSGSLDTFAGETNVDTENRLICYDIHDLGKQLMPIGMLVVLDNILNRITANKAKGRETYVFIDEIYLLFKH